MLTSCSLTVWVMCLHHMVLNDSVMHYREVPQHLLCELFDTSQLSVSTEALPQLQDVPIVKLEWGIPHSRADVAVEHELNGWAHVFPVLLVVTD